MTYRRVLGVALLAVSIALIVAALIVREADAQQLRCNPQGACVDRIDGPHVASRVLP